MMEKAKSRFEYLKILIPVIVTIITVLGSFIGMYLQGSKSATKIENIVLQINDAILPRLEKVLEGQNTEIKILRERVAVLEKLNEIQRVKISNTTFSPGLDSPLDLPQPAVKSLTTPATNILKKSAKYDFPRLQQEEP